ncbi:MAG: hypothetical protein GY829_11030 [Gammaproteobacteria bacterium]|nr:hypothetical protein [Gammaproteobacteria bacterium]
MKDDKSIVYLNTDLKDLPFKASFEQLKISDPMMIHQAIAEIETFDEIHTVVLDTITFLMDQYETQYVNTATNTMKAWGDYAQFYKKFMHTIKASNKNYIIFAHTKDVYNESELVMEVKVPVKGSVGHVGVEADFSTIISSKKVALTKLTETNKLLTITPKEEELGFKYVFQTFIDKDSVNDKMRSAMGLWADNEKYIDNNINFVTKRLEEYYN